MGVLDGLREGGRAVGVVSHVAELRTRIPCQVTVHKTESGSSVRVSLGGGNESAA
jgi:exonuclease SbcC